MAWNKALAVCTVAIVLVATTAQPTVPITCPNSSPCQTNLPAGYAPNLADCRRALKAFGGEAQMDQFCGKVGGNQGCVTTSTGTGNRLSTSFQSDCYGCVIKAFAKFQGQAVSVADKCLLNARANNEAPYTTECACECINGVSSADQANQCSTQCVNCRDFGSDTSSVGLCTCCIEHNVITGFNNDVASKCKQNARSFDVHLCPCYNDGCFPRSASVELDNGIHKTMDELRVGDRIKTVSRSGRETFEDVYFFGHESAISKVTYMSIQMADNTTLKVSPIHYVPIVRVGKEVKWESAEHVRAEHVREGMHMFVQCDSGMHAVLVNGVGVSVERGAYNPYTLGGYIVVDGVLASSHSGWLLDDAMDALGATAMVPSLYQALLAPMRWTYRMLGARAMTRIGPLVMNFGLAAAEMKVVSVLIKTTAAVGAKAIMAAIPLAIAAAMLRRMMLTAGGAKKLA